MKKILFLANHFITLHSFRKEMIQAMLEKGYEVYLSLPASTDNAYFEQIGCTILPTKINRRGINPIKDLELIKSYWKMMNKIKPDIIFSFTIKPNIYGSIVSNILGYRQICNITGTGATFLKKGLLCIVCEFLYRISVKKCYKVYFQNTGDRNYFINHKMVCENFAMIPGSGCNLEQHQYKPLPNMNHLYFIYIGRVMKLKGIDEYLICAKSIKRKYPNTTFYIAGWNEEPEYMERVDKAENEGYICYLGFRRDIDSWIEKCHCTILASHGGEGVPNVLLESAATGRICIGSRINGTKEAIDDTITGYLFEKGNAKDLIDKVEKFILLPNDIKEKMGKASRAKMEKEFDRSIVVNAYLNDILNLG